MAYFLKWFLIEITQSQSIYNMTKPLLLALLPCGLRNLFKTVLFSHFPDYINELGESEAFIVDGNLNYEKTFYDDIDASSDLKNLPDILISSDINSFYHKSFLNRFLNDEYFEVFNCPLNMSYAEAGYYHPENLFVMLPANILVIVADTKATDDSNLPTSWADLLKPMWQRKIALRGDKDFFCNAVFFPFVKTYGLESLKRLAHNTAIGLHPSQMVKIGRAHV